MRALGEPRGGPAQDALAAVGAAHGRFVALAARPAGPGERLAQRGDELVQALPQHAVLGEPGDLQSGPVQIGDAALLVDGHDAAGDRLHDRRVEGLELVQPRLPLGQLGSGALHLFGKERGQRAREEERGEVQHHGQRDARGGQRRVREVAGRGLDDPVLHPEQQRAEHQRRGHGPQHRAPAAQADRAVHDRHRIQDGEDALRPAGQVDEAGGREHVGRQVRVQKTAQEAPAPQQHHRDERGDVDAADDRVEVRLDAAWERLGAQREQRRRHQQCGAHQQPDAGEQDELAVEVPRLRPFGLGSVADHLAT